MSVEYGQKIDISPNKTYTVALKNGFVCTIVNGKTKINEHGLHFFSDGQVCTFSAGLPGRHEDYEIAQILPEPLPPLPSGYTWAGGWPTLREIKVNEYYLTNYSENYGSHYGADINRGELAKYNRIALEKIEQVAQFPKEDPEEYVDITDLFPDMHARIGIDESRSEKGVMQWAIESEAHKKSPSASMTIGEWHKEGGIRHRCKRKHLPVATPVKNNTLQYPIYYLMYPESNNNAKFVIRTSYSECKCVGYDGKPFTRNTTGKWKDAEDNAVRNGTYLLSSKEEYEKFIAANEKYPIYYSVAPKHGNRFVIKINDTQCRIVTLKGEQSDFVWSKGDDAAVSSKQYVLSSKEEYDKWITSLSSEQQPTASPLPEKSITKYYLHKDRHIGNGWIAYVEVIGDTILWHSFRQELGEPRKENGDFVIKYGKSWSEVPKEEALKFYNLEWPKPIYYKNNGPGPNYLIRTSAATCSIVISNGKTISGKTWINSSDYEETTESNVMGFIAACEEFESFADKVELPSVSKVKRAANYFVIEPATNMARVAVKSLRYIVLVGTISGAIGTYAYPEQVKKLLPKINIKFESPRIFKS